MPLIRRSSAWGRALAKAGLPALLSGAALIGGGTTGTGGPSGLAAPMLLADALISRPEEEVFLFALSLDQTTLSNTFPGFSVKSGYLLPLGELCRLLELGVRVEPSRGLADGFLLNEQCRFHLDVLAGFVEIQGVRTSLDRSLIELHADDIYVDARMLAAWLPVALEVLPGRATVTVKPREPLPLQLRWKREREAGRVQPERQVQAFPKVADPYRLIEVPFVDETLTLNAQSQSARGGRLQAQSSTFLSGDLLGFSTSLYANMDTQGGPADFRATLGRTDPAAGLLGPLQATEFAFGQVLNPGLNLTVLPSAGTGALVSNFPLEQANAFDRHSFKGDLPPGWQVELYRNQALVAFQTSRPDGQYEFLNLPLTYGWNDFRLVFYGPQGQRREEVARFDVAASQTPAGVFQYRLAGDHPTGLGSRAQFEARYGLTGQLSATFALARAEFDGSAYHTYTEAGLQGFWKPLSAAFTAASDSQGGTATELGLRTRLGTLSLNAKHAELQGGFTSEVFRPLYGPLRSRSSLDASAQLPSLERSWFTVEVGGTQDRLVAGGEVDSLYSRLSTSFLGYFLSNQLTRTSGTGGQAAVPTSTTGSLLGSRLFKAFSLRGQADYQLSGGRKLTSLGLTAETPVLAPLILRAGLTHTVATGETLVQLGANKSKGAFSLGLNFSYSTLSHLTASLTLRLGLGREPRQGRLAADAQGLASQGAVSAHAFIDSNGNGRQDPGEKDLEGVRFLVNGVPQPATTNKQGVAFLTHLSGGLDANLSVATGSLEDPLMRPSTPGLRVTPRPGHVTALEFPLIVLGELNGTVYQQQEPRNQELPGFTLELATPAGQVVRTVRTAYDGFYTLPGLPAGSYRLQVSAAEARRFGVQVPPPREVRIAPDGTVIDGLDLILLPAPVPPVQP